MRYLAAASPAFIDRHFGAGIDADSLTRAPSLVFSAKDELQARWAKGLCHQHVELHRHTLPSSRALVTAALAGMGWGLHPEALIAAYLDGGSLVESFIGTMPHTIRRAAKIRMDRAAVGRLSAPARFRS